MKAQKLFLKVKNSNGQALIESLFVMMSLCAVTLGFVSLLGLNLNKMLLDQLLYEGVLCLAQQKLPAHCQKQTHDKVRKLPFGAQILTLQFYQDARSWSGYLCWSYKAPGMHLRFQQQKSLKKSQMHVKKDLSSLVF